MVLLSADRRWTPKRQKRTQTSQKIKEKEAMSREPGARGREPCRGQGPRSQGPEARIPENKSKYMKVTLKPKNI